MHHYPTYHIVNNDSTLSVYFNADSCEKRNNLFIKQQHTVAHQQTQNTKLETHFSEHKEMNERMNQPTNKQTNERTNEWTNQQTNTDCDCFDADKASGSSSISSASWPPPNSTDLWLYAKAGRMRRWLSTASERSTNPQVFDCYLPIQRFPISALSS